MRASVEVAFTCVAENDGAVVIRFAEAPITWSTARLGDDRRDLRGITARTILLQLVRAGQA